LNDCALYLPYMQRSEKVKPQKGAPQAYGVRVQLPSIFDVAAEDYDLKSPMTKIVLPHYEVKKGKAFTKAEEKIIVDFCRQNPQYLGNSAMLVLLYTGM